MSSGYQTISSLKKKSIFLLNRLLSVSNLHAMLGTMGRNGEKSKEDFILEGRKHTLINGEWLAFL